MSDEQNLKLTRCYRVEGLSPAPFTVTEEELKAFVEAGTRALLACEVCDRHEQETEWLRGDGWHKPGTSVRPAADARCLVCDDVYHVAERIDGVTLRSRCSCWDTRHEQPREQQVGMSPTVEVRGSKYPFSAIAQPWAESRGEG